MRQKILEHDSQQRRAVCSFQIFLIRRNEITLTPDRQVVYVHLVPVVILYGVDKRVPFGFVQFYFTVGRLHDFVCRDHEHHVILADTGASGASAMSVHSSVYMSSTSESQWNTFELDVQAAELKLHSLQSLSERFMIMADGLLGARAEGQREILVRLLSVVVRPHCVHP